MAESVKYMVPLAVYDGTFDQVIIATTAQVAESYMKNPSDFKTKKGDGSVKHAQKQTTKPDKHGDKPTLNKFGQEVMGQVHDAIKKVDPNNIAGAIPPMLDVMKKLLNVTDPMQALQGMVGGGLYGQIMSMISQMAQQNQAGQVNNQPQPGDPCYIADTGQPGTLQYSNSALVCVAANTNPTRLIMVMPGTTS